MIRRAVSSPALSARQGSFFHAPDLRPSRSEEEPSREAAALYNRAHSPAHIGVTHPAAAFPAPVAVDERAVVTHRTRALTPSRGGKGPHASECRRQAQAWLRAYGTVTDAIAGAERLRVEGVLGDIQVRDARDAATDVVPDVRIEQVELYRQAIEWYARLLDAARSPRLRTHLVAQVGQASLDNLEARAAADATLACAHIRAADGLFFRVKHAQATTVRPQGPPPPSTEHEGQVSLPATLAERIASASARFDHLAVSRGEHLTVVWARWLATRAFEVDRAARRLEQLLAGAD